MAKLYNGITETKAHSEKSMTVSDVHVTDENGFVSCTMMIEAKNIIMKERTWINRVAQRDVTNVKRSGEWLNMESRNLVPGDLVKLTLGGLILPDCVGRENDLSGHVPDSAGYHEKGPKDSHFKLELSCTDRLPERVFSVRCLLRVMLSVVQTYWQGCVCSLCLCSSRLQQSARLSRGSRTSSIRSFQLLSHECRSHRTESSPHGSHRVHFAASHEHRE